MTSKTDRKGQTITYIYDALVRLVTKEHPDTTQVTYGYDLAGKLLTVGDASGSYAFNYDNMGRLIGTSTQYSFLTSTTFTNSYTYDKASNRTGFTAPDNSTVSYTYDTLNRLTNLSSSWAGAFTFGHDTLNRRTSLTPPNSFKTEYQYGLPSRLLSVLH